MRMPKPVNCTILCFFALIAIPASSLFAQDPASLRDPGPPIITSESIIFRFKERLDPSNIMEAGPPIVTAESIIFRYKGVKTTPLSVMVDGDFNEGKEPFPMTRNRHDLYYYVLERKGKRTLNIEGTRVKYRFRVDGSWIMDPQNDNETVDQRKREYSYLVIGTAATARLANMKMPDTVMVNGSFNNWEDPILMTKNKYDLFFCVFNRKGLKSIIVDEGTYSYRYLVDGVWMRDPYNPLVEYDRYGTEFSTFNVDAPIIVAEKNPVPVTRNDDYVFDYKNRNARGEVYLVTRTDYVFYYKNRNAREVYLVGDFNNWNPYSHPLRKNRSGLWEVVLDIPPGSYLYRFIVDGVYKPDPLNKDLVKDRSDNAYSSLKLPL